MVIFLTILFKVLRATVLNISDALSRKLGKLAIFTHFSLNSLLKYLKITSEIAIFEIFKGVKKSFKCKMIYINFNHLGQAMAEY